jgi:putative DNA primase/helicase
VLIFTNDPAWLGCLAFDEFSNKIVTRTKPPFKRQAGEWGDADALECKTWIEQAYGLRPTTPAICEAILMVAKRSAFNALQDYLNGLEDDSGEEALDTWLVDFFGAPDTPYTRAVGAKWLIAAVARAYDPGCKVDTVLILEGKQGLKKSRVLEQLCPRLDWFTDGLSDFGSKAQAEEVEGKWIVELGELKGFGKELEQIKAFVTRRAENYRPAYARYAVHSPRKCVFAGTVNPNHAGYFRDETGNRRYWPVECTKQAPEMTPGMRDRLWAEAKKRYLAGDKWWIEDEELQKAATEEQEKRVYIDPWHELIEEAIEGEHSTSVDEVLAALNVDKSKRSTAEAMRVGRVLTALKWIRYQDRLQNGRRVWRYANPRQSQPTLPGMDPQGSPGRHAA